MATSELGHYVRFDATLLNDEDPVDTGVARRALNNLNHIADQYARHLISAPANVVYEVDAGADPGTWFRVYTSGFFDVHVKSNGESYECRCRLRISSNHATDKATFRAVLAPAGDSEPELFEAGTNVFETTVTSTSYTRATEVIYMDDDRVARATQDVATVDSVGGAERTARWVQCQFVVFAKVDPGAVSALPRLSGFELHEYLAP